MGEALEEKDPPHLGQPAVQVAGTGGLLGQYLAPTSLSAYKKGGGVGALPGVKNNASPNAYGPVRAPGRGDGDRGGPGASSVARVARSVRAQWSRSGANASAHACPPRWEGTGNMHGEAF